MPTFELTSPKGETYRVDAPEGATEQQAQQMLQRKLAGLPSAPPKLAAPKQSFGDKAMDFVKSIPGGMLGGLSSAASAGGQAAQIEMGQPVDVPGPQETRQALEQNVTGELHKPQGPAGRYGETMGEFLGNPGSYLGPGGPARALVGTAAAGLASEAAGQATEGTKGEGLARTAAAFMAGFPFGRWRQQVNKTPAPLAEELFDAGRAQYKAIRDMDLRIKPGPIATVADGIASQLATEGFSKVNVPETFAVVERLQSMKKAPAGAFASGSDFDTARQELLQATRSVANPREAKAGWAAINELDKYLSKIPDADVLRGDGRLASHIFGEARGNWAAAKRLEMAGGKVELGGLNADTSHSGMNRDNALRQAIKQLIRPNKYGKTLAQQHGFNEREIAAMGEIARGTAATNTLRYFGNLLGGGGGLGQLAVAGAGVAAGYETGHPELMGLGLLGYGMRKGAGAMTERAAGRLMEDVGRRSPAGRANPPTVTPGQPGRSLLGNTVRSLEPEYGGPQ